MQTDSSDSAEKPSESSTELCKISIRCSVPEASSSWINKTKKTSDSESPPIITEDVKHSDDESVKSEGNQSHKSADCTLDTSCNRPLSPTSSITSQKKLEWDSLADVGYANETNTKRSSVNLSTLERLALLQQYSNSDNKENTDLGPPTAHSTLINANNETSANTKTDKKNLIKKSREIHQKDKDVVEFNLPHSSTSKSPQSFSVNLTKHISFNVEKDGDIVIGNTEKELSIKPNEEASHIDSTPELRVDKEIQTTLPKSSERKHSDLTSKQDVGPSSGQVPVLISLNTLRKRIRRRKRNSKRKPTKKTSQPIKQSNTTQEKSGDQVSEAESFEYMPGHIYNQNQMLSDNNKTKNSAGNKSSLESSGGLTTESSKTYNSFTKDLEKSIKLLNAVLKRHNDDSDIKKRVVKEIVQKLLTSKYRDEESSTDFLSGLSFDSKKLGLSTNRAKNYTTTSTSDANNTAENATRPRKSILRTNKLNTNVIASTSQSTPNLPHALKSENSVASKIIKPTTSPQAISDTSSKGKESSDTPFAKTSSEELYQKYVAAVKREEAYKRHLRDKELFLKQKLSASENIGPPMQQPRLSKIKELMNDLARNNYDDGSGDASKLEGGPNLGLVNSSKQVTNFRSHSVFTLSSDNSERKDRNDDRENRKINLRKRLEEEISSNNNNKRNENNPCYLYRKGFGVTDSSVQVSLQCGQNESALSNQTNNLVQQSQMQFDTVKCPISENIKYVCLCTSKGITHDAPDDIFIYKCSRLTNTGVQLDTDFTSKTSKTVFVQCGEEDDGSEPSCSRAKPTAPRNVTYKRDVYLKSCLPNNVLIRDDNSEKSNLRSKSSQTNLALNFMRRQLSDTSLWTDSSNGNRYVTARKYECRPNKTTLRETVVTSESKGYIHECTRCIQTEISIDPKIADPTISDINIVNEDECVAVISEEYRKLPKNSGTDDSTSESLRKVQDCKSSCTQVGKTSIKTTPRGSKETINYSGNKQNIGVQYQANDKVEDERDKNIDSYTIPFQGTNMTLLVSIGTNPPLDTAMLDVVSHGIETDAVEYENKGTSLQEDCTKGVQSDQSKAVGDVLVYAEEFTSCPRNNNSNSVVKSTTTHMEPKKDTTKVKPMPASSCGGSCDRYNTYPTNDKKPFLRSNTDTALLGNAAYGTKLDLRPVLFEKEIKNDDRTKIDLGNSPTIATISKYSTEKFSQSTDSSRKHSGRSTSCKNDSSTSDDRNNFKSCDTDGPGTDASGSSKDPILNLIQDITKRYSKRDLEKGKKKKCFKEIIKVLNYLLETDDSGESEPKKSCKSVSKDTEDDCDCNEKAQVSEKKPSSPNVKKYNDAITSPINQTTNKIAKETLDTATCCSPKQLIDKGIQLPQSRKCSSVTDSSDLPPSSKMAGTSSDSATCKVLNKIKKECEKYHQKRCKSCHKNEKNFETSSSTSINCNNCKRINHCSCRSHKCRGHKHGRAVVEKAQRKCVAYNLIIQTSDSLVSEEPVCSKSRPLHDIIVKVPPKKPTAYKTTCKTNKQEPTRPPSPRKQSPKPNRYNRSRSLPNGSEISSTDDYKRAQNNLTVRDCLERNRPDFIERTADRQTCLKMIREFRANERATHRQLLSLQLERDAPIKSISSSNIRQLAKELGVDIRERKVAPKFISEREMKKHSEKIYKSLPEVVKKKEDLKKESVKKTNLLMANLFKQNLQKKTLRGSVNISNYSAVIKI